MEVKKMESLKELYKIGRGPSSSHTMGPEKACRIFKKHTPDADRFEAILYGSLSKTGVGHGTGLSRLLLIRFPVMSFLMMKKLSFHTRIQWI